MSLTLAEIKELIADLENGSIRDINIQDGNFQLHLSKNDATVPAVAPATAVTNNVETPVAAVEATVPAAAAAAATTAAPAGAVIVSPMVGTIYLKPKPDAPQFKQVGDHVAVGETVAVVEAMKLMTDIKSDVAGTISEILVDSDDIVDFNKPIYRVTTD